MFLPTLLTKSTGPFTLLLILLRPKPKLDAKTALQPEIHDYFASVARQYGVLDHVRVGSVIEGVE